MSLWDTLFGKSAEMKALPTMSNEQQQLFSQLMGGMGGAQNQLMGYLSNLLSGSPEAMKPFEAPAMRQFSEQIVPGLAERFSGMGAGAQSSSAFGQALGSAGAGLAENLQAMRSGLQQQAISPLMSMMGMGLQTPTFNWQQIPGSEGALSPLLQGLGFAGGAAMGGLKPSSFSSLFNLFKKKAPEWNNTMLV